MLNGYRNVQNRHALKALLRNPQFPNKNLAIGGDDEMSNVPLLVFRDPSLPMPGPVTEDPLYTPYEKTAVKGAGDTLKLDYFVTDEFSLGDEYDSLL